MVNNLKLLLVKRPRYEILSCTMLLTKGKQYLDIWKLRHNNFENHVPPAVQRISKVLCTTPIETYDDKIIRKGARLQLASSFKIMCVYLRINLASVFDYLLFRILEIISNLSKPPSKKSAVSCHYIRT